MPAMTEREEKYKEFVLDSLKHAGYKSVAEVVELFPFHIIYDNDPVAFVTRTSPPEFYLNKYFIQPKNDPNFPEYLITVCVHEMSHLLLRHFHRMAKVFAEELGQDFDKVDEKVRERLMSGAITASSAAGDTRIANIITDLDIYCNVYTETLQRITREMKYPDSQGNLQSDVFVTDRDTKRQTLAGLKGKTAEQNFRELRKHKAPVWGRRFVYGTLNSDGDFVVDTEDERNEDYLQSENPETILYAPIKWEKSKWMPKEEKNKKK